MRIATPILGEGPSGRRRARNVLDRFLIAYGGDLEALELGGS